jgi:hypothetical protein
MTLDDSLAASYSGWSGVSLASAVVRKGNAGLNERLKGRKMKTRSISLPWAILLSISWMTSSKAQEIKSAKVAKPVVHYFNVAAAGILENQVAILTMSVSGAKSVSVTQSPCTPGDCLVTSGEATTTVLLSPTVTTTYTLVATNAGGTVTAKQTVEVGKYNNHPTPVPAGLQVTWGGACWWKLEGKEYQAMALDFQGGPPAGLPIEATLYFGSTTCNGEYGADNLNDYQTVIPPGGWYFWFTNHPDVKASSAIWTLGNQSSGCVSYEDAPACY